MIRDEKTMDGIYNICLCKLCDKPVSNSINKSLRHTPHEQTERDKHLLLDHRSQVLKRMLELALNLSIWLSG